MLSLTPIPAFNDNYIWLIGNPQTYKCLVVDPGCAKPVLSWLEQNPSWELEHILITHHHQDHTGGVAQLKQQTKAHVYGPATENIANLDTPLKDLDHLDLLGHSFQVIHTPGHTLGHLVYFCPQPQPFALTGDTLFAAGCGRIFEGNAEQMFQALQRLSQLPAETLLYPAHEYTLANLEFAHAAEPDNPDIKQRLQQVKQLRQQQKITLPTSLAVELATNPFLRCHSSSLASTLTSKGHLFEQHNQQQIFAALRAWKDNF